MKFRVDILLLASVLALTGLGIVMIYSSSAPYAEGRGFDSSFYLLSHLKKVLIGFGLFMAGMSIDYRIWKKLARPMFFVAVGMLIYLLVGSGGSEVHGAKRWISLAGFQFQPSEFLKIAIIMLLAVKLTENRDNMDDLQAGFIRPLLLAVVSFVLLLLQPNYSSALSVMAVAVLMVYIAGCNGKHLLSLFALMLPAGVLLALVAPYRMQRVLAFFDPQGNTASAHQQLQSLISLGNGGFFGTGLGQSTQKLGYLPMSFTDTIYAIFGEELGFLGTSILLGLFGLLLWRGLNAAYCTRDRFAQLLAVGITCSLAVNIVLHVGVCTRLLPATGQPLPLVSYGGTSLVMNLFALGILLNITAQNTTVAPFRPRKTFA